MSEELARRFHDHYERLAPIFGYETREATRIFDPESRNGRLMIAVADEIIVDLEAELTRLRSLAEAAEKLSADDARGIAEDLSVTLNKVPGGYIEKILAYADALDAAEVKGARG